MGVFKGWGRIQERGCIQVYTVNVFLKLQTLQVALIYLYYYMLSAGGGGQCASSLSGPIALPRLRTSKKIHDLLGEQN